MSNMENSATVPKTVEKQITLPATTFGVMAGGAGLVFGGVPAILRDKPLAGIAFGTCLLWAALGFGYSTLRTFVLNDSDFAGDRRTASTIAASVAGAARGALQGPRSIAAGAVMFSLLGYSGQRLYDVLDNSGQKKTVGVLERVANHKWSPVTKLGDDEYAKIVHEQKLKLDVDIALLDDRIAKLGKTGGESNQPTSSRPVREGPR